MNAEIKEAIDEAFKMLPPKMDSEKARVMLYAIGFQESRFEHRRQMDNGPARGFWQFEKGGGVKGVLTHSASMLHMQEICQLRNVAFTQDAVWNALEHDDVLAAATARLLLYTDAFPLPGVNEPLKGWSYYKRVWRPGKPHPETWGKCWNDALKESK